MDAGRCWGQYTCQKISWTSKRKMERLISWLKQANNEEGEECNLLNFRYKYDYYSCIGTICKFRADLTINL